MRPPAQRAAESRARFVAFWVGRALAQQRCEHGNNGPLKQVKIGSAQRNPAHAQNTGPLPPQQYAPKSPFDKPATKRDSAIGEALDENLL